MQNELFDDDLIQTRNFRPRISQDKAIDRNGELLKATNAFVVGEQRRKNVILVLDRGHFP